jgi:hypothetical protein
MLRTAAVNAVDLSRGFGERLQSAAAAGMWVMAVPNRRYPPPPELIGTATYS